MAYRYYRGELSRSDVAVYDALAEGLERMQEEIELPESPDIGDVNWLKELVVLDNPSLFHIGQSASARIEGPRVTFVPQYAMSAAGASSRWACIERRVADFKSTLPSNASDYDKAAGAYEFIIGSCEYGFSDDDQNMCSALCDGVSCCAGYSSAYKYLLDRVGVPCIRIVGTAKGKRSQGPHSWNAVCIDGGWSWVDSTWGDPIYAGGEEETISYDYLCVDERDMAGTHFVGRTVAGLLPRCADGSHEWHSIHHVLFDRYDLDCIREAVQGDVLAREIGFGRDLDGECHLKFTCRKDQQRAYEELMVGGRLRGMLAPVYDVYGYSIGAIACTHNDEMLTVSARYPIIKKT